MVNSRIRLRSNETARQLIKYSCVGVLSNTAGYLIYLLLTYFGTQPKLAMTVLYATGATFGFFGNRNVTFSHSDRIIGPGVRYVLAHTFGYLLNLAILAVFVDRLGFSHQVVQAAAIVLVAAFLFIAFKFFVFKSRPATAHKKNERMSFMSY